MIYNSSLYQRSVKIGAARALLCHSSEEALYRYILLHNITKQEPHILHASYYMDEPSLTSGCWRLLPRYLSLPSNRTLIALQIWNKKKVKTEVAKNTHKTQLNIFMELITIYQTVPFFVHDMQNQKLWVQQDHISKYTIHDWQWSDRSAWTEIA